MSATFLKTLSSSVSETFNEEVRHVSEWLNANKLSLNVRKSNLILFRKCRAKMTYKPDIKIMGEHIKEREYAKYLVVLIDKTLSWTYHINHVNLKISRGKAILTKLRHYVSKDTLRMLYFAFVQPNIDYGLIVWGSATPSTLKPIQTNIKKTLRKMLFKKSNHSTELLFQKLNILHFDKLKLLKIGIFTRKVLNDEVSQTLKDHFSIRERNHAYNNAKFHVQLANTNLFKQDIVYKGPKLWNSIPANIRNKVSLTTFKTTLNNYLLSNN